MNPLQLGRASFYAPWREAMSESRTCNFAAIFSVSGNGQSVPEMIMGLRGARATDLAKSFYLFPLGCGSEWRAACR